MREWFATLPWWSMPAAHAATLAGCAIWAWVQARRLDSRPAEEGDSLKELTAADSEAATVIGTLTLAFYVLPSPWPGTLYGIGEWLAACALTVVMFIPVRKRAAKVETPDMDIARGVLAQILIGAFFLLSVIVPLLLLGVSSLDNAMSVEWATFRMFAGASACYGAALIFWAFFAPWAVSRATQGRIDDGILFDMTEAAFKRAGLPAPSVLLGDGRLEGQHLVYYCDAPLGLSRAVILVDQDILSVVTVRELSAALCHEAAHAARNHVAHAALRQWLVAALPCAVLWLAGVAADRFAPDHVIPVLVSSGAAAFLAAHVWSMRVSRAQEMDADADAVLLYGAEPEAMLDVVAVLDRMNGGIEKPRFWELRTHPHLDERTAELRRRVAFSAK